MSSSSDPFPLYNLPRLCFLKVAEHLDNRERRTLAQTCERFRQLLIPIDRYSNPPTSYWDESSLDEQFSEHSRLKLPRLETRRSLGFMRIYDYGYRREFDVFLLDEITRWNRHILVSAERQSSPHESRSTTNVDDIGAFRCDRPIVYHSHKICGEWPIILHKTIHEINKYFVFEHVHIHFETDEDLQLPYTLSTRQAPRHNEILLPYMLTTRHDYGHALVTLQHKESGGITGGITEALLCVLVKIFEGNMTSGSRSLIFMFLLDRLRETLNAQTLGMLKTIWNRNSRAVEWMPLENYRQIDVRKTEENKLIVSYDRQYHERF